ncbi:NAD-dependent epimerase/dehydratase family protein [Flavobacterium myungsuense]|uniref:NAD-dependent epimerase/dehydratase family protein n=1 Tax=Flavobacterium myungsuense TaxID=651823 RepID=A0ABW3J1L5_9FLAO
MNVAVVGANGFLGKSLVKFLLKKNIDVSAFSRKPIGLNCNWLEYTISSISDLSCFKEYDFVFYCAACGVQSKSNTNIIEITEVNLLFPIRLSSFLRNTKVRLVTFGSYFEIGDSDSNKEWIEEEIIYSRNSFTGNYILTKKAFSYFNYISKSTIHFILPTIYGEYEDENRIIPYLINNLKNGLEVHVSKGEQIRQYIYVNDLIFCLWSVLNEPIENNVYNAPYAETFKIKDIIYMIACHFRSKQLVKIKGEFKDNSMKILKIKSSEIFLKHNFNFIKLNDNLDVYFN